MLANLRAGGESKMWNAENICGMVVLGLGLGLWLGLGVGLSLGAVIKVRGRSGIPAPRSASIFI